MKKNTIEVIKVIEKVLEYLNTGRSREMTDEMRKCSLAQSQLAIKQTMELNNQYHTPEEIVCIMSEITGEKLDESSDCFHRFILISEGISILEEMCLSIPVVTFRIRAEYISGMTH